MSEEIEFVDAGTPGDFALALKAAFEERARIEAEAIDTVARNYLVKAVRDAYELNDIDWSEYPELSEADFDRVGARALEIAEDLEHSEELYEAAYAMLARRAGTGARP
jgi:hypothetical protein